MGALPQTPPMFYLWPNIRNKRPIFCSKKTQLSYPYLRDTCGWVVATHPLRLSASCSCSHHHYSSHSDSTPCIQPIYVIIIAIDFSKAFDTVRHKTLLDKMSQLDIPDNIFNWLVDVLAGHSHQTHYGDSVSQIKSITAGIIQGSAIGPTSYVVTVTRPGNL